MPKFTAAVVQDSPVVFDPEATIGKLHTLAKQARDKEADLVLFPEAFVSAYPRGLDFGARIGYRTPAGREDYRRYLDSAIEVPSPQCDRIGQAAKENGLWLVVGVIEREGGTIYCTALTFSPDGVLAGKHRKLMPTASERLVWGFGDGSTMAVVDSPLGKIGSVICWENYMPLLRTYMYSQGVQIYCAPTADGRESWLPTMRHIAMEGRCFVLTCNQFLTRGDCPKDYDIDPEIFGGDSPETILTGGGSAIIDPLGEVLVGPLFNEPGILTAEIDLDQIGRGKYDFDAVGHYARPDVFRLHVKPQSPTGRWSSPPARSRTRSPKRTDRAAADDIQNRGRSASVFLFN